MALFRLILVVALMFLAPLGLDAAEQAGIQNAAAEAHGATTGHEAGAKAEGLPLYATPLFHIGPLPVTISMVVTRAVALLLIIGAQVAMRRFDRWRFVGHTLSPWRSPSGSG